jgi:Domain of unknown function (DU1801)
MAELKTTRTGASVPEFLAAVPDPRRRADAEALCALMTEATGVPPAMWGPSIVGFGTYRYKYASGREGDWPPVSFAPRRQALTLYLTDIDRYADLLGRLGPHKLSGSCVHLKRLADVEETVLRDLVATAFRDRAGQTVITANDA